MGLLGSIARFVRRLLMGLATGYIVYFFSESLFWGRYNPETKSDEFVISWIAYSILAMIFLATVSRFRVRSFWALFLSAAVFGWCAEGILAQTMYESFPIQLSWTGLAWHAQLVIGAGWYLGRRALASGSWAKLILWAVGWGLFWGCWSVFWWVENQGQRTPLAEYEAYAWHAGVLLALALFLENRLQPREFLTSWLEIGVLTLIAAGWFVLAVAVPRPWTLLILLPLLGGLFATLRRNQRREPPGSLLEELKQPIIPWYRYLVVLLTPLVTIAVYSVMWEIGHGLPTNWVVYSVGTPSGFILLGISVYKVWKGPPPGSAVPGSSTPPVASLAAGTAGHSDS